MTTDRDAERDQLAAALADLRAPITGVPLVTNIRNVDVADALLPVVDRIANVRAAAELRAAGKALHVDPLLRAADYASYVKGKLDDLAAALDPT